MEEITQQTQDVLDKMEPYTMLMTLFAEKALDNKKNKEQFKKIKELYFNTAKQAFHQVITTSKTKKTIEAQKALQELIEKVNKGEI